jgi:hypothetical protein
MMKKDNDGASRKFENKTAGGKRRALKRAKKRKYGGGESGKAKAAAAISREFAEGQLEMMGASKKKPKGIKDADTKYMPVIDREKDAMKKGAAMMKKKGASMSKKYGSSMSGESYDAKEAYNKNLSASARLHYLENNRADKKAKGKGHRSPIMKHMRGI